MIVGNVAALVQDNIKRLLGYSSIAHAGYLLVGLVAAQRRAPGETRGPRYPEPPVLFRRVFLHEPRSLRRRHLLGAARRGVCPPVSDYAGLARRRPWLAAMMALFMVSLAGVPPTVGFVGKFYLFGAVIDAGHAWLAIVGLLTSVVSAYYYLRVVYVMYMQGPSAEPAPTRTLSARGDGRRGVRRSGAPPGPRTEHSPGPGPRLPGRPDPVAPSETGRPGLAPTLPSPVATGEGMRRPPRCGGGAIGGPAMPTAPWTSGFRQSDDRRGPREA